MTIWTEYTLMCAHRLPNLPVEHQCSRMHGHNYKIKLWISAPLDPHLGWLLDYAHVTAVWTSLVHSELDHRCLNDIMPNPTCELLAVWIAERMQLGLPVHAKLVRVEIQEEPTSGVVYEP